ncbi:unnamed protein product [Brassica oleracea]
MFSNPVQSLVPLQPHCRCISFNATAIVTSRFYGAKLYHLNLLLLVTAGSIVQECGFARFARYILTVASPSHYAVSSIDGSSHCRICGPPNILVAGTIIVQECGFARFTNFITAALPSHYASDSCLRRLPSTSHCNSYSGSISTPHCNVGRSSHLQRQFSAALNSTSNSTSSRSIECRLEYYK